MTTMSARAGFVGIVAELVVLVAGATSGGAAGQAERVRTFSGCPAFLEHVRARALPLVGSWGMGGGGLVVAMPSAARGGDLAGVPAPMSSSRARMSRRRASTSPT